MECCDLQNGWVGRGLCVRVCTRVSEGESVCPFLHSWGVHFLVVFLVKTWPRYGEQLKEHRLWIPAQPFTTWATPWAWLSAGIKGRHLHAPCKAVREKWDHLYLANNSICSMQTMSASLIHNKKPQSILGKYILYKCLFYFKYDNITEKSQSPSKVTV